MMLFDEDAQPIADKNPLQFEVGSSGSDFELPWIALRCLLPVSHSFPNDFIETQETYRGHFSYE
jgi:hypothetical protein